MFDMALPFIKGLYLLMMLHGRIVAGQNAENPLDAQPDFLSYGCRPTYCCSRIEKQGTILNAISNTTVKLANDISEINVGVVVDIPVQLEKQAVALDELKTAVLTDIPFQLEKQSSELKRIKESIGSIAISLNKHSEEHLIHDARLEQQGTILNAISNTTMKLAKDISEINVGVVVDIPVQLEKQEEALDELKTAVGTDIPSMIEQQSSELKRMKASIDSIAISLNKHSEELLIHDARLEQQGQLLETLTSLLKEVHVSLVGPKDCSDIRAMGHNTSGVYRAYPGSLAKRIQADVYCDMTTSGGSWLVFQRRKDGSMNFERTWNEYLNGFGNPSGEFWLGNELVYLLTSNGNYKLRIDMEDFDGQKRYAEYSNFSVSSSADLFRMTVSGYTGDAGDSLAWHNGMQFSTIDADNDIYAEGSCSLLYHGGWWYTTCHSSNPNGLYLRGNHTSYADGVEWVTFRGTYYSLKMTEMKISTQ